MGSGLNYDRLSKIRKIEKNGHRRLRQLPRFLTCTVAEQERRAMNREYRRQRLAGETILDYGDWLKQVVTADADHHQQSR